MATTTENYGLIKPAEEDFISLADWNENMDTLDSALAENGGALAEISGKIGQAGDTGTDTLFGMLGSGGGSLIKSLQRVTYSNTLGTTEVSLAISKVEPAKCFVYLERLQDTASGLSRVEYTLGAESISLDHVNRNTAELKLGFWVIEFN